MTRTAPERRGRENLAAEQGGGGVIGPAQDPGSAETLTEPAGMTRYRETAQVQQGRVTPIADASTRPGLFDDEQDDLAASMERHPAAGSGPPPALEIVIPGRPRGQGSLTMVTKSYARYSDAVIEQRNLITDALRVEWAGRDPITGPVEVNITAGHERPKYHYGTGRNAGQLKGSAPTQPVARNTNVDIDKAARLVLDALTVARVIGDDCLVVDLHARKCWAAHACTIIGLRVLT